MDLLTQGLLGSSVALSIARPQDIRKAAVIGLLAGVSADIDIFIRSANDPLLNLEFHRHFTHSIFFIPVASLLLSLLFWPFFKKHLAWPRILLYCFAGYLLSGFIDACTSYGTRLLWPLSDERISFNIISIIDPVFTLILLTGVIIGTSSKRQKVTRLCLLLAAAYLLLGTWQKIEIQRLTREYAQQQGHQIERLLVKPTLGNNLLWRSVYQHQGQYFVNAFRLNPVTRASSVIPGDSINAFSSTGNNLQLPEDSILQNDIRRFARFSDQYLALHPQNSDIIIDVRYSNLPNSILPLWGIRLDPNTPQQHAHYEFYRDSSAQTRQAFIDMLKGDESKPLR
jgi:inner membrane protein